MQNASVLEETLTTKERLSSLMDGELDAVSDSLVSSVSESDEMQACWYRYHVMRDVMCRKLPDQVLSLDITKQIAQVIENEALPLVEQPLPQTIKPTAQSLFWIKVREMGGRIGQVGLAACVTLAVITGVQYYGEGSNESAQPLLNTMPVGVSVAPVGGISKFDIENNQLNRRDQMTEMEQEQYDKVLFLLQDYELQKRVNANK